MLRSVAAALLLSLIVLAGAARAQAQEVRLRPVQVGDQTVSGFVLPEPATAAGFILEVYDTSTDPPRFVDRRTIDRFERGGGFSVQLGAAIRGNQRIEITQNGASLMGGRFDVVAPKPPAPPTVTLRMPNAGEQAVGGIILPPPKSPEGFSVDVRTANALVERKALERVDAATGTFSVTMTAPLRAGQTVSIVGGGVAANSATVPLFQVAALLRPTLVDGSRIVRGSVAGRVGVAAVVVKVTRSALENTEERRRPVQMKRGGVGDFDDLGQFTVTLEAPVIAGQIVTAEVLSAGGEISPNSDSVTVRDPGNWGRARAYFAGGVVFSKERDDFSKQDLALGFVIDKGWLQRPDFTLPAERGVTNPEDAVRLEMLDVQRDECERMRERALRQECLEPLERDREDVLLKYRPRGRMAFRQLNTFFDTRLTALPVSTPTIAQTTTTTSTTAGGQQTQTTQSTAQQFIDSRKGAVIQVGVYAPFYGPQTSWVHEGAVNALFLAPLFRFGIQTIPAASGTPSLNARGEADDIYNQWGFGFGLGHQKLSGTTNQTPEVLSYLHITWGKSEAFQYKVNPSDTDVVDKTRTMVEGRLKIPDTALQVGFDANLGDGRDDLRFVFGTRFDIGELFGRLRSFQASATR